MMLSAFMYSHKLLEHFEHPRNVGEIENPTALAEMQNPVCGDVLRLSLLVAEGKVVQARFQAKGCVPAIACGSLLTELLTGRTVEQANQFTAGELEKAIGRLPPASHHASELAIDVLRAALKRLPK